MTLPVWAALLIVLNVLDSVSTHIGLYKLPKELRGREGNPLMAKLMAGVPKIAEVLKHGSGVAIVVYCLYHDYIFGLVVSVFILGFAVLNNTYLIVRKRRTKRQHTSPFILLARRLRVPSWLHYPFTMLIIVGPSLLIAYLIVR